MRHDICLCLHVRSNFPHCNKLGGVNEVFSSFLFLACKPFSLSLNEDEEEVNLFRIDTSLFPLIFVSLLSLFSPVRCNYFLGVIRPLPSIICVVPLSLLMTNE